MILTLADKGAEFTRLTVNRCRELHYHRGVEGWQTDGLEPCEFNKLTPQAVQELIEQIRNNPGTAFYLD